MKKFTPIVLAAALAVSVAAPVAHASDPWPIWPPAPAGGDPWPIDPPAPPPPVEENSNSFFDGLLDSLLGLFGG